MHHQKRYMYAGRHLCTHKRTEDKPSAMRDGAQRSPRGWSECALGAIHVQHTRKNCSLKSPIEVQAGCARRTRTPWDTAIHGGRVAIDRDLCGESLGGPRVGVKVFTAQVVRTVSHRSACNVEISSSMSGPPRLSPHRGLY